MSTKREYRQSGNIFFALFGAIALVGLLGAAAMTFMRGPLQSAVKITRQNTAEAQMSIAGQVAVMAAASAANNGDCDTDGFVEPLEWRDAGALPKPTGGGLIPNTIGINKKDPWGTEYGYCVWDHGPTTLNASCELTTPGTDMRLEGANSRLFPVVAIISAGPDKTFTTTCRNFATGADRADQNNDGDLLDAGDRELVGKAAPTDDDVIFTYSYEEATGASGGLWQLKSVDPNIATINKSLEVSGGATFQGTGTFQRLAATGSDFLDVLSGIRLPNPTTMPTCNVANLGVLRRNVSGTGLEICSAGNTWMPTTGTGSASALATDPTCTGAGDAGKIRYDTVSGQPQFCNGTSWQPFMLSSPVASMVVSPASDYAMNVTGPCSGGNCPFAFSTWRTFTAQNQGNTATAVLSVPTITGANASNFEIDLGTSTCDNGIALQPAGQAGNSCTLVVRARANGNVPHSAQINFVAGALSATVPLYGTAVGFGCSAGAIGWGGIVTQNCTGPGGTEPGTGQIILQPSGCGCGTNEPACTFAANGAGDCSNTIPFAQSMEHVSGAITTISNGAQNTANLVSPGYLGSTGAAFYCDNLVLGGYTDWYLPSISELTDITTNPTLLATMATATSAFYWSSTINRITDAHTGDTSSGVSGRRTDVGSTGEYFATTLTNSRIRCIRKHNTPLPSPQTDTVPFYLMTYGGATISRLITHTPNLSARTQSREIPVVGINAPVSFTVSGSGSPAITINGGSEVTSGTISQADRIRIVLTSPASVGQSVTGSVTIGTGTPISYTVRTTDPSIVVRMFVTSDTRAANAFGGGGGIVGADAWCATRATAAGLAGGSTYRALLSTHTTNGFDRIDWRTGRIENIAGDVIANNMDNLLSGSLLSTIRSESNTVITNEVWTGLQSNPPLRPNSPLVVEYCGNWNSTGSRASVGTGNTTGPAWASSIENGSCTTPRSIYCFGPN
jgi:hypothetical protein